MSDGAAEQADAADEAHGGWKDSKMACLHLKSASQLIRGVRPTESAGRGTVAPFTHCVPDGAHRVEYRAGHGVI